MTQKQPKGTRVWTCDGCGKKETWRAGWTHIPFVASLANVGFPMVTCCGACEDKTIAKVLTG